MGDHEKLNGGVGAMRVVLFALLVSVTAVIFQVPANEQVCLGEELGYDMVVHGVYKASGEGELKVEVVQTVLEEDVAADPTKIVSKEGKEGSFGFTTEKQGEFRFCFQSEASSVDHDLEVDFTLKVGFEAKDYAEVAKKEHLKPVELSDMANEIFVEMSAIRQREVLHRQTTDSNNTAVMGWSMLSLVIIVVLGLYQTYYLR